MTTIQDILRKYNKKVDFLDVELLLAEILKKDRAFVITHPEYRLNQRQITKVRTYLKRRINYEPLAYILGRKEFYGLDFAVNRSVLIPRPETELLVDKVIKHIDNNKASEFAIIDIGTGSGNIIITLADILTENNKRNTSYWGLDISDMALRTAKKNSRRFKLEKKIRFKKSNLLSEVMKDIKKNKFQEIILVSNLPYLSQMIYRKTSLEIRRYEPQSALVSSKDGTAHYEKLFYDIEQLKSFHPNTKIIFFIEFSPEQKSLLHQTAKSIFSQVKLTFFKDYSSRFRVMSGRL